VESDGCDITAILSNAISTCSSRTSRNRVLLLLIIADSLMSSFVIFVIVAVEIIVALNLTTVCKRSLILSRTASIILSDASSFAAIKVELIIS
jgi:hypothetical protein